MANAILLTVLAASAASLYGLLAIWAGLGRGHWFVRAAVVAAAIGMLLPVPAFDLAIVFLSQALSVAAPLLLLEMIRSAKHRNVACDSEITEPIPSGHRFTLVDLFLLTLVAAGAASLGAYLPAKHRDFWLSYMMIGAGAGIVTLAAAWAALGRRWPILRWAVLIAAAPAVGWLLRLAEVPEELSENLFGASALLGIPGAPAWFAPTSMSLTAALIAAPLACFQSAGWLKIFVSGRLGRTAALASPGWTRRIAGSLAVVVLSAASLFFATIYFKALFPPRAPHLQTPNPNGYDALAKLGGELAQTSVFEIDEPSEAEKRAFVSANFGKLDAAHAALDLPHAVPISYDSDDLHVERFSELRNLWRALAIQGQLAVLDHRPEDAVQSYVDDVRMGRVIAHDGLVVHYLVGIASEGTGVSGLSEVRNSISIETCRRLLDELCRLDAARDRVDEVLERDRIWELRTGGWSARTPFSPEGTFASAVHSTGNTSVSRMRLLIYDLAIRLYRADHGRPPERLEQLAPKYLRQLLDDPFTGRPPIYRPQGESYRLYSVGPDLDDDGGAAIPGGVLYGDGDFTLDPTDAPAASDPSE
ncbi:MAG TPA: hypothetical protein VN699_02325 [Pirellulales bacterium]|nr:hypothetical protein [Pirellulales bacterium]